MTNRIQDNEVIGVNETASGEYFAKLIVDDTAWYGELHDNAELALWEFQEMMRTLQ
jgi:hypothetical protein